MEIIMFENWTDVISTSSNDSDLCPDDYIISFSSKHTRSLTILKALSKLNLLKTKPSGFSQAITIHLVGCDFHEGNNVEESLDIFSYLIDFLFKSNCCTTLNLVLVGPNVSQQFQHGFKQVYNYDLLNCTVNFIYFADIWDKYACLDNDIYYAPDVFFCFNAGIWGYEEWLPTIDAMRQKAPSASIIITSYNGNEAVDDQETIEEYERFKNIDWVWQPEINPFASEYIRTSKSVANRTLAENSYWQCIR